ncbi:hypothetical protein PG993_010399 [Apiospora rasikravindrae]|uniref:CUE domain-containing protein n=1 Tax=Apiospora rasikravindrae TaxID=990691 RepID=A0ABR1SNU7_9PEZI
MPGKSHHRKRPSVDRVFELLADLDESQMEALLQEVNSTTAGNIAVSQGIDFFERPLSPGATSALPSPPTSPRASRQSRQFLTSLSPRKQTELRRRVSNRISSAPEPRARTAALEQATSSPNSNKKMNRGYRRISRPWGLPSPTASPDLRELLVAYLAGLSLPPSSNTTATSSPATSQSSFSPASSIFEAEADSPGMDLLEPSPLRNKRSVAAFGRPIEEPVNNIGDIFEVLGPSH